jgi:hypothetical protein
MSESAEGGDEGDDDDEEEEDHPDVAGARAIEFALPVVYERPAGVSWRMDPKTSFSDWTLEVVRIGRDVGNCAAGGVQLYHVHRSILAFGPRTSGVLKKSFVSSPSTSSRIELAIGVADAFPAFLDWSYYNYRAEKDECAIDAKHLPAFQLIAKKLHVPILEELVENELNWYKLDRLVNNHSLVQRIRTLFESACTVCNGRVLTFLFEVFINWIRHSNLSLKRFVRHFCSMLDEEGLLRILYHETLLDSTEIREGAKKFHALAVSSENSRRLCKLVARYCLSYEATLSRESFECLTNEACLPSLDLQSIPSLLKVALQVQAFPRTERHRCTELSEWAASFQRRFLAVFTPDFFLSHRDAMNAMQPLLLTLTPHCLLQMMAGLTSYVFARMEENVTDDEATAAAEAT